MATFTIKTVPLSTIGKDGYQRQLSDTAVDAIVNHFDLAQWNLPKVVEQKNGDHRVVAGQHRVEAARKMSAQGKWPFTEPDGQLLCQVISGLSSQTEEADLFLSDANNTRRLTAFDKHIARLVAKHPDAEGVQLALDNVKVKLVHKQKSQNGHTSRPSACSTTPTRWAARRWWMRRWSLPPRRGLPPTSIGSGATSSVVWRSSSASGRLLAPTTRRGSSACCIVRSISRRPSSVGPVGCLPRRTCRMTPTFRSRLSFGHPRRSLGLTAPTAIHVVVGATQLVHWEPSNPVEGVHRDNHTYRLRPGA